MNVALLTKYTTYHLRNTVLKTDLDVSAIKRVSLVTKKKKEQVNRKNSRDLYLNSFVVSFKAKEIIFVDALPICLFVLRFIPFFSNKIPSRNKGVCHVSSVYRWVRDLWETLLEDSYNICLGEIVTFLRYCTPQSTFFHITFGDIVIIPVFPFVNTT